MSRRRTQGLRFLVPAVMLTVVVAACAPGVAPVTSRPIARHTDASRPDGRRPVPTRAVAAAAPACSATVSVRGALFWADDPRGATRRLDVRLQVLPEASASWRLDGRVRVEEALAPWNRAGLPVRLVRADRGDSPAIRVTVVRRLPLDPEDGSLAYRAGVTHLRYDASGSIISAQVLLAEETPRGEPYSVRDQVATLMHELGHALGLPHSEHPYALMSARTVAMSLTPHDVALARAVYGGRSCRGGGPVTASRND